LITTDGRIEEDDRVLLSGKCTGLRGWIRKKGSESKGSSGGEKWREMASLITSVFHQRYEAMFMRVVLGQLYCMVLRHGH